MTLVEALRRLFGTHQPDPMRQLTDEIRGFQKLAPGWNSHRAPHISELAIKSAVQVVEVIARRGVKLPTAAPTPQGIALTWDFPDTEAQLLVDDESFDFSVARRGQPKVLDHGTLWEISEVETRFIDRYVVQR